MPRKTTIATAAAAMVLAAGVATIATPSNAQEAGGRLAIVQALPDTSLVVTIDGREVARPHPRARSSGR